MPLSVFRGSESVGYGLLGALIGHTPSLLATSKTGLRIGLRAQAPRTTAPCHSMGSIHPSPLPPSKRESDTRDVEDRIRREIFSCLDIPAHPPVTSSRHGMLAVLAHGAASGAATRKGCMGFRGRGCCCCCCAPTVRATVWKHRVRAWPRRSRSRFGRLEVWGTHALDSLTTKCTTLRAAP